jgi:hypothetical protein
LELFYSGVSGIVVVGSGLWELLVPDQVTIDV